VARITGNTGRHGDVAAVARPRRLRDLMEGAPRSAAAAVPLRRLK
jgi:hypothetical protein